MSAIPDKCSNNGPCVKSIVMDRTQKTVVFDQGPWICPFLAGNPSSYTFWVCWNRVLLTAENGVETLKGRHGSWKFG
jgi:hypothetical protein